MERQKKWNFTKKKQPTTSEGILQNILSTDWWTRGWFCLIYMYASNYKHQFTKSSDTCVCMCAVNEQWLKKALEYYPKSNFWLISNGVAAWIGLSAKTDNNGTTRLHNALRWVQFVYILLCVHIFIHISLPNIFQEKTQWCSAIEEDDTRWEQKVGTFHRYWSPDGWPLECEYSTKHGGRNCCCRQGEESPWLATSTKIFILWKRWNPRVQEGTQYTDHEWNEVFGSRTGNGNRLYDRRCM